MNKKLLIDDKYEIDIVGEPSIGKKDVYNTAGKLLPITVMTLNVSYNILEYPDLTDYLQKVFFPREFLDFFFDGEHHTVLIRSSSFSINNGPQNEGVNLFEAEFAKAYRDSHTVPLDKRKEFVEIQACGDISFSIL